MEHLGTTRDHESYVIRVFVGKSEPGVERKTLLYWPRRSYLELDRGVKPAKAGK